ncbi:MFS transporter [Microbacterium sp. gxy059]|uniref:MFS transporter n=1 Tax=Microbacterium sp. gxy059 TaxID=2957199 RepID=UPI003D97773B
MTASTPSLWANHRYVAWLPSDTSKELAQALFGFAIPLLALMVTDGPAQAGVIGAIGMTTRVALTLYGGVLADRHRRILLMVTGGVVGVVLAAAFTLLAVGDALTFASLLVVDVLLAARSGLFDVAGEAALKEIVAPETMGRAQAANQARSAALQLAGGPLGGALLVAGGWLVAAVMTVAHALAAATAALIPRLRGPRIPEDPAPTPADPRRNALREMREGVAWLFSRPDLRGVLLVTTLVNLGINSAVTTVIYALQQEGRSPAVIGWIGAAVGAGMLLGALVAGVLVSRVPTGILTVAGLGMLALGSAAVTLTTAPWAIALLLIVPALLVPAVNAGLGGYFMVATPSALLGRANSATSVFAMGAMPLAPLIAGFGLAWIGRTGTILIAAGICAAAALLAVGTRGLRALPSEPGWSTHATLYADRIAAEPRP